jgi:hypothetical protein
MGCTSSAEKPEASKPRWEETRWSDGNLAVASGLAYSPEGNSAEGTLFVSRKQVDGLVHAVSPAVVQRRVAAPSFRKTPSGVRRLATAFQRATIS